MTLELTGFLNVCTTWFYRSEWLVYRYIITKHIDTVTCI